jgi:hypothetical protein
MSFFFHLQNQEQEGGTGPVGCKGGVLIPVGGQSRRRKSMEGKYSANTVYTCVNGKIIPVETIPGMVRRGIKENDGGGKLK